MKKLFFAILVCVCFVFPVFSQRAWENRNGDKNQRGEWEAKAVDKWNSEDVKIILLHSPWGRSLRSPNTSGVSRSGPARNPVSVAYNLRSALVVRFALIRELQIEKKYDSMDAKAKAEFDTKNSSLLQCPQCKDYYIISLRGDSLELNNASAVQAHQKSIFLSNDKGEKRVLAKFSPQTGSGTEALFFFPRNDEKGQPLITPDNKKVAFNFADPDIDKDSPKGLIKYFEINVPDIVREGVVVF